MEIYRTEEEQVEALKHWWKNNNKSVLAGVVIGVAVLWGGSLWKQNQYEHRGAASMEYQTMLQAMQDGQADRASDAGQRLLGQYADTSYAALGALALAKLKLDQKDLLSAKSHLRWALDNAADEDVQHLARVRLARVLLAEAQSADALALLNGIEPGHFRAVYEELKGDIYVAQNNTALARGAYAAALEALGADSNSRALVQLKLDDLGDDAPKGG